MVTLLRQLFGGSTPDPTAAPRVLVRDRPFGRDEYAPLCIKATTVFGEARADLDVSGDPRDVLDALHAWLGRDPQRIP
jgi:hypothetical protein